mmetsp:Transcript_15879/g.43161  ORF Transcript_15879/g.43161 Transcript_15879/m.43161 type:complete len:187 (-) Transcript_15879:404-964(-)
MLHTLCTLCVYTDQLLHHSSSHSLAYHRSRSLNVIQRRFHLHASENLFVVPQLLPPLSIPSHSLTLKMECTRSLCNVNVHLHRHLLLHAPENPCAVYSSSARASCQLSRMFIGSPDNQDSCHVATSVAPKQHIQPLVHHLVFLDLPHHSSAPNTSSCTASFAGLQHGSGAPARPAHIFLPLARGRY